jgi:hypothetical protein
MALIDLSSRTVMKALRDAYTGQAEARPNSPPYVSFRTFLNFIEWLELGVPDRIDRSFWGQRLSGSYGNQLISGMRFLRLIAEGDRPTDALGKLAAYPSERKRVLHDLLQLSYARVFELDLTRATRAQLEGRFRDFGIRGERLRKAMSFFIQAARYADIPLSNFIAGRVRAQKQQDSSRRSSLPARNGKAQRDASSRTLVPGHMAADRIDDDLLHPALCGMLNDLPRRARPWTPDEKQRWLAAFASVLEWAFPARSGPDKHSAN